MRTPGWLEKANSRIYARRGKPGESGNRSGRPRRSQISDRYEPLAEVRLSKQARNTLKLPPEVKRRIKTYGDLLAWSQFQSGIKGKTEAAREIADRIEGRAGRRVEMAGPDGREVVLHVVYDEGEEPK